jgi:hypothetical protein
MVDTFAAKLSQQSSGAAFSHAEALRSAAMEWLKRTPGPPGPWHPRAIPACAGHRASARGRGRACGPRAGARGPTASRRAPQSSGADPGGPHGRGDAGAPACRGAPGHRPPPGDGRPCAAWPGAAGAGPQSARPLWGDGAGARGGALRRRAGLGQGPGRPAACAPHAFPRRLSGRTPPHGDKRRGDGSVTKRVLCIAVESTYECKTRGEEPWHCPPRGEADTYTRHPFHAKMSSRAPSKPCLRATFLLRFPRRKWFWQ